MTLAEWKSHIMLQAARQDDVYYVGGEDTPNAKHWIRTNAEGRRQAVDELVSEGILEARGPNAKGYKEFRLAGEKSILDRKSDLPGC